MDAITAQRVARRAHLGQLSRSGEPIIDHVERVAKAVPAEARPIAYLHDVLERSDWTVDELRGRGLTDGELSVLELLSRSTEESYEVHVMRIGRAPGDGGRIARTIKLADLDDHLSRRIAIGSPNYAWARAQIAALINREDALLGGALNDASAAAAAAY